MSAGTKQMIGAALLFILAAAAWLNRQKIFSDLAPNSAKKLYSEKITIGTEIWPGYLALYVAQDRGYFKEAGLDVEIKSYVGQAPRETIQRLREGENAGTGQFNPGRFERTPAGL